MSNSNEYPTWLQNIIDCQEVSKLDKKICIESYKWILDNPLQQDLVNHVPSADSVGGAFQWDAVPPSTKFWMDISDTISYHFSNTKQ